MSLYDRFAEILGPARLRQVERQLGGRRLRIRKYSERVDPRLFSGKPLTLAALAHLLGKSGRQASRIKKRFGA